MIICKISHNVNTVQDCDEQEDCEAVPFQFEIDRLDVASMCIYAICSSHTWSTAVLVQQGNGRKEPWRWLSSASRNASCLTERCQFSQYNYLITNSWLWLYGNQMRHTVSYIQLAILFLSPLIPNYPHLSTLTYPHFSIPTYLSHLCCFLCGCLCWHSAWWSRVWPPAGQIYVTTCHVCIHFTFIFWEVSAVGT